MDHEWAAQQLTAFIDKINQLHEDERTLRLLDNGGRLEHGEDGELQHSVNRAQDDLTVHEPAIRMLMDAVDATLRDYTDVFDQTDIDGDPVIRWNNRWEPAKQAALTALGLHTFGAEVKKRMQPDAPDFVADRLHAWVWDAARPQLDAGSLQTAVLHAAQTINSRLQQKLGRVDVSEGDLCAQAFSTKAPEPGKPRLRFEGDRSTDNWKSLQNGSVTFAQGCFTAIRNPVAHDHQFPLSLQQALEQLAALSVLARWIDSCEVEHAPVSIT